MSDSFMDRFSEGAPDPASGRPSRRQRRSSGGRGAPVLTVVAVLLLASGVGLLGWVAYQYFGTNVVSQQAFDQERVSLRQQWQQQEPAAKDGSAKGGVVAKVVPGDAIALLRIPAFGSDYEIPILAGTELSILDRGVGHYDNTAMPGQVGNFAVAGHRITHGQPFAKLLDLNRGDQIVVETRDDIYTYVLDEAPRDLTVKDTATWVIDPVPGKTDVKPTEAMMTLTTCQDLFHSPDRSIGFAHLVSTKAKG